MKKSLVGYKKNAQNEKKFLPLHLIIPFLKQLGIEFWKADCITPSM